MYRVYTLSSQTGNSCPAAHTERKGKRKTMINNENRLKEWGRKEEK
jgi:hypothetical protein